MIKWSHERDQVQNSPLPSLAHVFDAASRCACIRFNVTSMLFEAVDDGTPILWRLLVDSHISKAS